jgi:hypothetical protein
VTILLTKLDVARRQLETAARLYFNNGDIVSVHTLTSAAYEIVETIASKRGLSTLTQRSLLDFLSEDLVKEVRQAMRHPQNFFKHADRDSGEQLEFDPRFTEYRLLDAMVTYIQITGEAPVIFNAFSGWFIFQYPKAIVQPADTQEQFLKTRQKFAGMRREVFLKEYTAHTVKLGTP